MSVLHPTSLERKPPYITVSAKGLSNGQSSIPNDGADFGPDTLLNATAPNQYGPPYTQTSGIQEALNYLQNIGGGTLRLKSGTYTASETLTYDSTSHQNNNNIDLSIIGDPGTVVNVPNLYFVISPQITRDNLLMIKNIEFVSNASKSQYSGAIYTFWGYNPSASPSEPEQYVGTLILKNVKFENPNPNTNMCCDLLWATFMKRVIMDRVHAYGASTTLSLQLQGVYFYDIRNSYFESQAGIIEYSDAPNGDLKISNCVIKLDNTSNNFSTATFATAPTGSMIYRSIDIEDTEIYDNAVDRGGIGIDMKTSTTRVNAKIKNVRVHGSSAAAVYLHGAMNASIENVVAENSARWLVYFLIDPNFDSVIRINNIRGNISKAALYFESSGSSTDGTIGTGRIDIDNLMPFYAPNTYLFQFYNGNTINMTGSPPFEVTVNKIIKLNNSHQNLFNSRQYYLALQGCHMVNGVYVSMCLPQPLPVTTPSVPASGTAQQNTYPYSVNVALYGGTVTQITITRQGTTYTVFSNSSGAALSGQIYRLEPGDSITLTYSSAPTWTWLPA